METSRHEPRLGVVHGPLQGLCDGPMGPNASRVALRLTMTPKVSLSDVDMRLRWTIVSLPPYTSKSLVMSLFHRNLKSHNEGRVSSK